MKTFKQFLTEAKLGAGTYPGPAPADHKTNKEFQAAVKGQVGFKGRLMTHELEKHASRFGNVEKVVVGHKKKTYHYDDGGTKEYHQDMLGSWHHYHKVSVRGFRK